MQYTAPCRVVNGSAYVEFLYVAVFQNLVGDFSVGETLTLASGAEAVLLGIDGTFYTFAVTSAIQPVAFDAVTGDLSSATADVSSYETAPDINGFGIVAGAFFLRDGDQIAYVTDAIFSRSRIHLGAAYGGVSSDSATGVLHNTRTENFSLPSFDRRDGNLPVLLNELVTLVDAVLQDHEERIVALEP